MKNLSLILLFTILCLCDICVGQTALPESRQSSAEIYVYKLGTADMRKLYDTYQDEWEQFLHTLVASYPDTAATPLLPRGNYLLVQATGNRLKYNLHTVDDLQYDFVNDNRLRLRLTNRTGETVANAQAQVGHRTMRYDPEEEVYTAGKIRRERLLAIEHEGVRHLIAITPEGRFAAVPLGPRIGNFFRRQWYGIPLWFQAKKQPDRSGGSVFVTDKPKYRPGETVRWKAHAGTPKGRPIEKPLELWLNRHERKDTLLATITPTQPGVYYGEFTLDNALELKLDRTYNLQLKTEDGETILARGTFRHEDYELDGLQFSINSDRQSHRRNTPPTLTLKATDENGIAAMEGRYELTARPTAPYEWETASGYVPDILWEKTIDIQSGASEKITLPDSIFPEGVSFNYRVEGRFVSADNAVKTAFANLHYDGRKSAILIEETATGIRISQSTGSEVDAVPLEITAYTAAGEEISRKEKMSPANYRLPAHASHLTIRSGQAERIYSLSEYKRQPLTVDFYRQNDSIHAQAHNPGEYPFWYQLRKGKHVIAEDYATAFVHHGKQRGAQPYVLSVQYLFGGKIRTIEKSLSIWEKNIHVEVATPTLVYPGQKAQVEVSLTDHKGRPVRNADVTAYAMTSKFNSNLPRIPYWGKTKQDRYKSLDTEETTRNLQNVDGKMTWERWRREMGLDSIAYYRFLHPEPVYLYSDSVKGDMTQIAPYAVIDGELQPVYVIKTYGEPIYYQGTNHLPVYCFRVRGSHPNIELRLSDRIVTLTKVELERGKRHILSVDASQSNPDAGVTVTLLPEKQKGRLSLEERNFLSKYLIGVEDVSKKQSFYGVVGRLPEPEHIQNEERLYYLNAPTTQAYPKFRIQIPPRSVLTGPFPELGKAGLYLKDTLMREFDIEGGYDYKIQNDYIRLKSFAQDRIDQHLIYHGQLRPDFLAQALQRKDVERLHKEHLVELLKQRSPIRTIDWDYKANKFIEPQAKGTLEFDIRSPQDSASLLFILLMNEDQSARWTFAPKGRRLTKLPEGKMTLTFVKDDFSHARQEVEIRKDGTTFFRIDSLATKRDTIYAEWLRHYLWKELFHKSQEVQPEHLTQAIPADEVHGRVFSAFDGSPLPGCTVLAKGRFIGTTTDENGYFALQVPEGCDTLELNYVGFWPELLAITKGDAYNIYLSVKEGSLEEVAVIGYSVIERKLLTSAIQTIKTQDSRALAGKAAEIIAWNAAAAEANAGGQSPLIIVDGKPFAGTLTDLDENSIVSIKRLSPEEGRELYGNRAAGGALIVTTGKQLEADTPGNSLRQNFNDAAFWQPHLLTDKEGKVSFETTYPDDITSWDAYFLAFGPQKRTGATEVNIKSFKSLMARLSLPRFAITGDSLNAIGQLNNYQGDTVTVTRKFTTGEVTSEKEMTLASSHVDTIPLIAPVSDSLQATYSLETANGYFDGEKRAIPVYRPGCEESEGIFLLLDKDTTFTLTLDSLAGIITAMPKPLHLNCSCKKSKRWTCTPISATNKWPPS